ncbi:hypothetical protein [Flavobacterium ardleyense]|uniref:hypothetical protein n=1 Tax=Flavobacterium ardleyense TaxID=2038737 RepID=UPI00298C348C|nr:hypothetical protein [Flavobacterium ardleyense]
MKKINSISLFVMGGLLLPVGIFTTNYYVQIVALSLSIVLSILAIIKSFKEKKTRNN